MSAGMVDRALDLALGGFLSGDKLKFVYKFFMSFALHPDMGRLSLQGENIAKNSP